MRRLNRFEGSNPSLSADRLRRMPRWAPPAALFAPVWTVLYVLMAIAAFRVWRRQGALFVPHLLWVSFALCLIAEILGCYLPYLGGASWIVTVGGVDASR